MPKNLKWKLLLIAGVLVACIYSFVPPRDKIKLGLDLKGGIHLVLQVVIDDALNQELYQTAEKISLDFKSKNIPFVSAKKGGGYSIEVVAVDPAKEKDAREYLNTNYDREYTIRSTVVESKTNYTLILQGSVLRQLKEKTVEQALKTIRSRVDNLGVSEPTIQPYGGSTTDVQDQIIVELPGVDVDDRERIKEIMKSTAQLELRLVKKEQGGPFSTVEAAVQANGGKIAEDWELLLYREEKDRGEKNQIQYLIVSKVPTITGRHLKDARRSTDSNGAPAVGFFLNSEGAQLFSRATEQHVGDRLAVVLDKVVRSAPVINERIGAEGIIHGTFTIKEAEDLSLVLRSGALPASIKIVEERDVGASLGNDSIQKGIVASIVGSTSVVLLMLIYYRLSGVNAVVCLIGNLIILLGFMGRVRATLTLPGIAGIILTIGMAVDSNILIFERIKEEMRAGKTVRSAIDAGFSKVFWTILDTHVTTLVAAAFLFQFGTGPIRGFAVTLTVGLIANVFTAIFVSRRIYEIVMGNRKVETLSV